jgi:hypothetical protein
MIGIHSPRNEVELALIRSLLDAESIPDHVFGTLKVVPSIEGYNVKAIMVAEEHRDRAAALVADFRERTRDAEAAPAAPRSRLDKLRIALEVALSFWFVPGRRWRDK